MVFDKISRTAMNIITGEGRSKGFISKDLKIYFSEKLVNKLT